MLPAHRPSRAVCNSDKNADLLIVNDLLFGFRVGTIVKMNQTGADQRPQTVDETQFDRMRPLNFPLPLTRPIMHIFAAAHTQLSRFFIVYQQSLQSSTFPLQPVKADLAINTNKGTFVVLLKYKYKKLNNMLF